jgi:hypothetical protein
VICFEVVIRGGGVHIHHTHVSQHANALAIEANVGRRGGGGKEGGGSYAGVVGECARGHGGGSGGGGWTTRRVPGEGI